MRSLDKDPTKRLWGELKESVVEDVLQDQISALFPTGALVVEALMDRLGILHTKQTLVVIPDHPRLGKFREEFAGLIGALQLHPTEGPDNTPGFANSREIEGTKGLWKSLAESPKHRVDALKFLKARLLDILINDKDRHSGQWRWARFQDGDGYTWQPIPAAPARCSSYVQADPRTVFTTQSPISACSPSTSVPSCWSYPTRTLAREDGHGRSRPELT